MMKLLQELRGFAQLSQRRPQPKQPGLFLMQLRTHLSQTTSARRKLVIPIQMHELPDIPTEVKITIMDAETGLPSPIPTE